MATGERIRIAGQHGRSTPVPRLHVITPDASIDAGQLQPVLAAGAPLIQLRRKSGSDRERHAWISALLDVARPAGAQVLVNDRVDLALAAGADGVHLGLDDLPVAVARQLLGPDAIVGGTCRDAEDARRAEAEGATYIGCGPVYRSATKTAGLPDPMGAAGIERIASAVSIPVIAIAGVSLAHVPELLDAGAHGVAVIAAVFAAPDPGEATRAFLAALGGADAGAVS